MPGTLIKLTAAGRAALVGPGNTGTQSRQVVSVGIANAPFAHSEGLTALPNEYKRVATIAGQNVAPDTIHVTIRDDSADQYTAYGLGLYLDNGVLLGTYSQATPILEKAPAAIFMLSTDMQFASIDAALLTFGDASFANPPATTEVQGVIEIATQAETDLGVDAARAVTPKTLAPRLALLAPLTSAALLGVPTAPTPALGDDTQRLATTAFVQATVRDALVGQIVLEPRKTARAGFLKLNGALFNRADYPLLWAYAQASGALVSEAEWSAGARGCFSSGDGATTFRIPEVRGEFLRCWDDGRGVDTARGIGTYQGFQNALHTHTASLSAAGDHTHSTWTDAQGWHGHHGNTGGGGGHNHGILGGDTQISMSGPSTVDGHSRQGIRQYTEWAGDHGHAFDTDGAGTHGHNIGMNGSGNHIHAVTIAADGGTEARPRNIAMLAMIRAF